jgi:predicted DNA-binding transcriptional regulator YafY
MPLNKYALLRYRIIHRCLTDQHHPYPDKDYLRAQCEEALYGTYDGRHVSLKTIERDLRDMREDPMLGYHAPVLYHREHKGYYYGDPGFDPDRGPLKPSEREALAFAAQTLFQFRDAGMFQPYAFAIEKIFAQLQISGEEASGEPQIQFESAPLVRGQEFLHPLYRAAHQRLKVRFWHHKFGATAATLRTISPFLLKEYRNRWYVIGTETGRTEIKSFGLERISDVVVLDEPGDQPRGIDPAARFRHAIGITEGGLEPETVILAFTPHQRNYLNTQPLHASQEIVADTDHSYTIRLTVLVNYELIQTILGYGPDVLVLEPPHLRETIKHKLTATLKRYNPD